MPSNKFQVFVSANGDDVGIQTSQMTLANDAEGLRRLSGLLRSGAEIFGSWALAHGGETISVDGDGFLVRVPAECLADVPGLMEQYESLVGATLSVGVGRTLEESNKALAESKKNGKNRVTVHNGDQEEAVVKSQGDLDAPEEGDTSFDFGANAEPDAMIEEGKKVISRMRHPKKKMAEDFLRYAMGETNDRPQISPDLERHLARFGIVDPQGYTFDAYGRDMARPIGGRKVFNQEPASLKHNRMMNRDYYAPYQSYGGLKKSESYDKDLREDWGNLIAEKHKEGEQEEKQEAPELNDDVKKRVVSVLTKFKQMAPQLEEMQQSDPQLYASMTGMVQGMVEMARALFGQPQPVQKAEGNSFEQMRARHFEQMRARHEAKKVRAKELADTTMGSAWSSKLGGFLVVGLDPHNRNRWRVTNIAENGMEGLGHTVHPTHEEALLEAHSMGADIHGAPLQTMAKDEDWDWSTGQLQKMEDSEEDLGKMAKLGPTFPGLGLPDNRRTTDMARPVGGRKVFNQEPAALRHNRLMNKDYHAPYSSYGGVKKAEELEKVGMTGESTAQRMRPHMPRETEVYDKIETYRSPSGKFHHALYRKPIRGTYQPVLHVLSNYENPSLEGIASSSAAVQPANEPRRFANNPWKTEPVVVHGETVSVGPKGTGTELYQNMLAIHGRMVSDISTSKQANNVWEKLARDPAVKVGLGYEDGHRHWAEYTGSKPEPIKTILGDGRSLRKLLSGPNPYSSTTRSYSLKTPGDYLEVQSFHPEDGKVGIQSFMVDHKNRKLFSVGPYHTSRGYPGVNRYYGFHDEAAGPARITAEKETGYNYAGDASDEYMTPYAPKGINKAELELNKGVLDPKAGYKISHETEEVPQGVHRFTKQPVPAHKNLKILAHKDGKIVGSLHLDRIEADSTAITPFQVEVDPQHRRKGLASAMYAYAERVSGLKIRPSSTQSPAGRALWEGNDDKQFGHDPGGAIRKSGERFEGGLADDTEDSEFDPEQLAAGIKVELEHTQDHDIAKEIAKDHLFEDPAYYTKLAEMESADLDKAALEAGKTGRHHVILPVGSVKEPGAGGTQEAGKIKTMDPQTGKTKWKSIRAGVVMAEDGTPQSSRLV